jgi:hypothetical protein
MRDRLRSALAFFFVAGALSMLLAACFDLFHSTDDIVTACTEDASQEGCQLFEAAVDSNPTSVDFCTWDSGTAHANATHACAWLGACRSPMGDTDRTFARGNAFGACMISALLAYDCSLNPNRRPKAATLAFWECMANAKTCGDVQHCVQPTGTDCKSPGNFTACYPAVGATGRLECTSEGGTAFGENCAAWGQTCASDPNNSFGVCAAGPGDAGTSCSLPGCTGTRLDWCPEAGTNVGVDCDNYGAQKCIATPTDGGVLPACQAEKAGACSPTLPVSCSASKASGCPSGVGETVDCNALLGAPSCHVPEGGVAPVPWDISSMCYVDPAQCSVDTCNGNQVVACERGATFTVDCASVGLGTCRLVQTDLGTQTRAACTAP